jgi:hypothetical protein
LIHFLVLGALLVGLRSLFVSVPLETTPSPVFVDAVVVARLERDWSRSTGGPPTAAELDAMVQDYVDQELLVRAALDLGLHRSDALVQRRLIQNQRFGESTRDRGSASDAELLERAFALGLERSDLVVRRRLVERMREIILADSALSGEQSRTSSGERSRTSNAAASHHTRIRLFQLYLSRDRHGDTLDALALQLRERLVAAGWRPSSPELAALGDPFLLPREMPPASAERIEGQLGAGFARAVTRAPVAAWSEPIASSYGLHLVWVHERSGRAMSDPAESARRTAEHERASIQEALQILRRDVDVIRYDHPSPSDSPHPP